MHYIFVYVYFLLSKRVNKIQYNRLAAANSPKSRVLRMLALKFLCNVNNTSPHWSLSPINVTLKPGLRPLA